MLERVRSQLLSFEHAIALSPVGGFAYLEACAFAL
jgi:hypothetical protein